MRPTSSLLGTQTPARNDNEVSVLHGNARVRVYADVHVHYADPTKRCH